MATAKNKPRYRRLVTVSLIIAGIFIVGITVLHIWFVNNARSVLKEMVETKSKGKIKLELTKLSFEFLSNKLQIREADLISTDSLSQPTTYHIKFRKLTLRINSFWPLIMQKKLLLDSIKLHDPEVTVMQWRKDTTTKRSGDDLSISQEMGKLYNSMLEVLDDFGIRRIIINNAKVSLVNKMKVLSDPVTISNIFFDLKRTAENVKKRDAFVANEQSIELETSDQDITLPGGRHRLAFKRFHLELFGKRIQMDSCTLSALPTDSTKSSYTIFFKKLMLVGVDFEAMYLKNLIRADSVYCENPLFDINLNTLGKATKKREQPNPDAIVQELTGDLDLAFIGVKDAGIHIDIIGKKNRSLFNSNKDDFEMRGVRINADSSKPVVVKRFDMLVRDYRLYSEDSSAAYTFDSIHFTNNKIVLTNFSVATEMNRSRQNNYRDFKIPYFEVAGLNWYDLIFDQNVRAQEAKLYSPVINFKTTGASRSRNKTNLFTSLQSISEIVTLNKVTVVNGQIDVQLGTSTAFKLKNANLSLYSNQLLRSKSGEGLRRAVEELSFTNGAFRIKEVTARLQNVRSLPGNLLLADRISLSSTDNKVSGYMNDVVLDNMLLNDLDEKIEIDGIRWGSAAVNLQGSSGGAANKKNSGGIQLKNLSGSNTNIKFSNGPTTASTFITAIKLASLIKEGSAPIRTEGLLLTGEKLAINNKGTLINAARYDIVGNGSSSLTGLRFEQHKDRDSLLFMAPRIGFSANLNSLLAKDLAIESVEVSEPTINMVKRGQAVPKKAAANPLNLRVNRIIMDEPLIAVAIHKNDSSSYINLPRSSNSTLQASGLVIGDGEVALGSLIAKSTGFTFVKPTGEIIGVENGIVDLDLSNLLLSKKNGVSSWSGLVNNLNLSNPSPFLLGKNRNSLFVNQLSLGNLSLSSAYLSNIDQLIKYNVSAWLKTGTGQYKDSNTTLKWYNAEYSYKNKTLTLDSFNYHPSQPRDTVIARSPFQTDYITFNAGLIKITDFNLDRYKKDSALLANTLSINNPVITIFRDKAPPFRGGTIKPLPVDKIKGIKLPLSIQRLNLYDGTLSYTERNAKTRAEGTLQLTHLNGGLANIKNSNFSSTDSLTITLNAFLMDSAQINLRVRESYTDTLSGFLMTLRMKPTTLSFLNPVLAPLSNVIIKSGRIDSFHLRAIGREELSFGEMKMYYRNLRIKLIKDGEEDKSSFVGNVVSFLANTFIIKKNNNGRTGLVYFERLRDRSFFNYIVKMTFSGMATSVGAKKNAKYRKAYNRELNERSLPPIDFQ